VPIFLLGAAILFWGWQIDLWWLALPMALGFEVAQWVPSRWDFADQDFRRIINLCLLVVLGLVAYLVITQRWTEATIIFLRWLPIVFLPLLLLQTYSTRTGLNLRTLFSKTDIAKTNPQSRHSPSAFLMGPTPRQPIDFAYPYFAICLLSASTTSVRDLGFYGGMCLLVGLVLWPLRSPRLGPAAWLSLLLLAGVGGFVGQMGLHQLHITLEQQAVQWLSGFFDGEVDPFQRDTSIGDIGEQKRSNRILFRVAAAENSLVPELLHQATYNRYQSSLWVAADSTFQVVAPDATGLTWDFRQLPVATSPDPDFDVAVVPPVQSQPQTQTQPQTITITDKLPKGRGLLKLPPGALQADQLAVAGLEQNQYGTVKVESESQALVYQVQFNPSQSHLAPPTPMDLQVPPLEQVALDQVLEHLALRDQTPEAVLQRIQQFFQQEFEYSLQWTGRPQNLTPLAEFLLTRRSGHCEYFATATTLLLRAAGIPARYAIGFSVHEFNRLENQYIVRARNAHAWTLAYVGGGWQTIDTTPGEWIALETANAPQWGILLDLWSLTRFKLAQVWQQLRQSPWLQRWWWLGLIILVVSLRQLKPGQQIRRITTTKAKANASVRLTSGGDSEFYQVEQYLNQLGLVRGTSETLQQWLDRMHQSLPERGMGELRSILRLHYRYRFDPQGIAPGERSQLRTLIQTWLTRQTTKRD
jgi:hypothetical protein